MLNHLLVVDYLKKKKKLPHPNPPPPPNFVRVLPKQKQKMDYVKMFLLVVISCWLSALLFCSFFFFFVCSFLRFFFLEGGSLLWLLFSDTHTHTHIFRFIFAVISLNVIRVQKIWKKKQNVSSLFDKKKSLTFVCVCVCRSKRVITNKQKNT